MLIDPNEYPALLPETPEAVLDGLSENEARGWFSEEARKRNLQLATRTLAWYLCRDTETGPAAMQVVLRFAETCLLWQAERRDYFTRRAERESMAELQRIRASRGLPPAD